MSRYRFTKRHTKSRSRKNSRDSRSDIKKSTPPPPPKRDALLVFATTGLSMGVIGIMITLLSSLLGPNGETSPIGTGVRPKVLGVVGVHTGFQSADLRATLRSTWFPSERLQKETNLVFKFVIGRTNDAREMEELDKEKNQYDDFMFIDVEEDYTKLLHKTLAFFKKASELFNADYYVKTDDDIYLRPDRLAPLLATERSNRLNYIGCMTTGLYGRNRKFLYAHGQIYILSAKAVKSLAKVKNHGYTMSNYEDVSVGFWMFVMGVQREDVQTLCNHQCTTTSIAVWDVSRCRGLCDPVNRMKVLHKNNMCSGKLNFL